MERNFEGIYITAGLWLSKDMNMTEKGMLLEIKSLDNDFGCIATNKKLGEVFELKPNTVSLLIKSLEEKGFISVTYEDYNTHKGRKITINYDACCHFFTPPIKSKGAPEKSKGAPEKSIHSINISNINSNLNINDDDKKSPSCYKEIIEFWLKEFHEGWAFTAVHGKQVKEIITKITTSLKTSNKDYDDEAIVDSFKAICRHLPEYYKNKDLQILNSKYNEIIAEIKSNRSGQQTFKNQRTPSRFRTA